MATQTKTASFHFQCACGYELEDAYHGKDQCIKIAHCAHCGKEHSKDMRCKCQPKPAPPTSSGWLTARK